MCIVCVGCSVCVGSTVWCVWIVRPHVVTDTMAGFLPAGLIYLLTLYTWYSVMLLVYTSPDIPVTLVYTSTYCYIVTLVLIYMYLLH